MASASESSNIDTGPRATLRAQAAALAHATTPAATAVPNSDNGTAEWATPATSGTPRRAACELLDANRAATLGRTHALEEAQTAEATIEADARANMFTKDNFTQCRKKWLAREGQ